MKKSLAILLALVLGMSLCFSACGKNTPQTPSTGTMTPGKDNDKDGPSQTPDSDKDKDTDKDKDEPSQTPDDNQDDPDTPPQPPAKTKAEAVADFDAFMQKIKTGKNFTYDETNRKVEFAVDKVKMDYSGDVTYLAQENGDSFVYELKTDNVWHKVLAEDGISIDKMIGSTTSSFDNVIWQSFDADDQTLFGKIEKKLSQYVTSTSQVEAKFVDGNGEASWEISIDNEKRGAFSKVGKTTVTLPANTKDDTVQDENIFTTENGQTVWDVKAIKEVLEPWLKNEMTDASGNHVDNQFGRPVFARVNDNKVREIIYINPTNKLEFGAILDNSNGSSFIAYNFSKWDEFFEQKIKISKSDLKEFLLSCQEKNMLATGLSYTGGIDLEYTTHDEDYETAHKQEFETLTKNVFEKYHKEKDAADPDYTGAKILFAFKGFASDMHLGSDGYGREFSLWYLVERKDGTMEFIESRLRGLISGPGYLENILQNQEGKWSFEYPDKVVRIAEISRENLVLFDAPIMTIGGAK